MNLAIEYAIRSGIVRRLLRLPCSLFLSNAYDEKRVITLHRFSGNPIVVKHWLVARCNSEQVLPSFHEFLVEEAHIFSDPHIVLTDHRLLHYEEEPVPTHFNNIHHPMIAEVYNAYSDNYLNNYRHRKKKENWLWDEFVRIFSPRLWPLVSPPPINYFVGSSVSEIDVRAEQRAIVCKYHHKQWLCWQRWRKYMLDFNVPFPTELVFSGSYAA